MESSEAIRRRLEREYVVLRAPTELDVVHAAEFERQLESIGPNADVVVDLCATAFCDSSGLRSLIHGHERFFPAGGSFTLSSPPDLLDRLLSVSGLERYFAIRREGRTRQPRPATGGSTS